MTRSNSSEGAPEAVEHPQCRVCDQRHDQYSEVDIPHYKDGVLTQARIAICAGCMLKGMTQGGMHIPFTEDDGSGPAEFYSGAQRIHHPYCPDPEHREHREYDEVAPFKMPPGTVLN